MPLGSGGSKFICSLIKLESFFGSSKHMGDLRGYVSSIMKETYAVNGASGRREMLVKEG